MIASGSCRDHDHLISRDGVGGNGSWPRCSLLGTRSSARRSFCDVNPVEARTDTRIVESPRPAGRERSDGSRVFDRGDRGDRGEFFRIGSTVSSPLPPMSPKTNSTSRSAQRRSRGESHGVRSSFPRWHTTSQSRNHRRQRADRGSSIRSPSSPGRYRSSSSGPASSSGLADRRWPREATWRTSDVMTSDRSLPGG